MLATMAVVEDGTLEESLVSRLWRLMDCYKETLRISETGCDAMRAAGLTAALEVKLLVYNIQAIKIVSGFWLVEHAKGFQRIRFLDGAGGHARRRRFR